VLLGVGDDWRTGLGLAGVQVVGGAMADGADVAVCSPGELSAALGTGAPTVLVEGDIRRVPGRVCTRWLVLLRRDEPLVLVPAGQGPALQAGLQLWAPVGRRKEALKRGLQTSARVRLGPGLPVLTVVTDAASEPLLLQTARALGAHGPLVPVILTGGGSLRRRVATQLLRPAATAPELVLKTERHSGGLERAERDRRWSTAAAAAAVAGVRVPQVLAISDPQAGPVSSLEEAAPGRPLSQLLTRDRQAARAALDTLVHWLARLAAATAVRGPRPPEGPLPLADPLGLLDQARAAVAGVPGVLTHGDLLDGGNVLVARGGVCVVDWETAQPQGLPLRDLLPTLTYGLAVLRVGAHPQAVADEIVRTALGLGPDAALVRARVSSWARTLGLDSAEIGPLSLLAWAHHGAMPAVHRADLAQAGLPEQHWDSAAELVARAWLEHPGLGVHWPALLSGS
jgi:hypothetical protein